MPDHPGYLRLHGDLARPGEVTLQARNREVGRAALESVVELDAGNNEALALRERASRFEERAAETLDARP